MKSISIPTSIVPDIEDYAVGDEICVRLEGEITAMGDGEATLKLSDTSIEDYSEHSDEGDQGDGKDEEYGKRRALVIGIVGKPRE